jgi:hypothetical protein
MNGNDTKATHIFWGANVSPSNLALATITRFLARPKESSSPLIDSFSNPGWKKSSGHSMGKHGCENRINKKKMSPIGERSPSPTGKAHVTLSHNRVGQQGEACEWKGIGRGKFEGRKRQRNQKLWPWRQPNQHLF